MGLEVRKTIRLNWRAIGLITAPTAPAAAKRSIAPRCETTCWCGGAWSGALGIRLAGRMIFDDEESPAPEGEKANGNGRYKWGKPDAPLTARQLAFVEEFLKDGRASRAAVAAGYSPKRAKETASELLADVRIAAAVLSRSDELAGNLQSARDEAGAAQAELVERTDDEIARELHALSGKARSLMAVAEGAGDLKTALAGLREITRLIELKAKLAGRIAGARIEINLNSINVELLSDTDLEAFLNRAKDRVERIRARELDELIPPEQMERIYRSGLVRRMEEELGCFVEYEEVLEIVRAAKADQIETMKRAQEANLTSAEPVRQAVPQVEAPAARAEPAAPIAAVGTAPVAPVVDIRSRDRLLAQLDDRRRRW